MDVLDLMQDGPRWPQLEHVDGVVLLRSVIKRDGGDEDDLVCECTLPPSTGGYHLLPLWGKKTTTRSRSFQCKAKCPRHPHHPRSRTVNREAMINSPLNQNNPLLKALTEGVTREV